MNNEISIFIITMITGYILGKGIEQIVRFKKENSQQNKTEDALRRNDV